MYVVGEPLVLIPKISVTYVCGRRAMSVVGEHLVLISKISVTYVCGRRTLSFNI